MRVILLLAILFAGCAETVGCPPGQYFGPAGACVAIPDGALTDGGPSDGG